MADATELRKQLLHQPTEEPTLQTDKDKAFDMRAKIGGWIEKFKIDHKDLIGKETWAALPDNDSKNPAKQELDASITKWEQKATDDLQNILNSHVNKYLGIGKQS